MAPTTKNLLTGVFLVAVLPVCALGGDLYRVSLRGAHDAHLLAATGAEPVLQAGNDYLVLLDPAAAENLALHRLDHQLIARGLTREQLAIDPRPDAKYTGDLPVLYQNGELRLLRITPGDARRAGVVPDLWPLPERRPEIRYTPPRAGVYTPAANGMDLRTLIGLVSQDSVTANLYRLEAFYRRVAGTDSLRAARDWILDRFRAYGYATAHIDSFQATYYGSTNPAYNVVATRPGARYPDAQVVIGAHYDAVPNSPGVDDNGTGTAAVLEIARVLRYIPTDMSLTFVAFDAEEAYLVGSYHFVDSIHAAGTKNLVMFNVDMIGDEFNSYAAHLHHGPITRAVNTWASLSDSLVGISGVLSGGGASDHMPFIEKGYDGAFVQEYYFSTVYHRPQDSTSHINFDYMTRMIKATLAATYVTAMDDDFDDDWIKNDHDNCPNTFNPTQDDSDGDGVGEVCDNCPSRYNPGQADSDGDGIGDLCDLCSDESPHLTLTGDEGGLLLGHVVDGAGDVNGDGYDDVIVGRNGSRVLASERAYVYSGHDGTVLYTLRGGQHNSWFGAAVAGVGDVNGDGFGEVLVGAPSEDADGVNCGRAYLFLGGPGPYPHELTVADAHFVFHGSEAGGYLGSALAGISDLDGDSAPDLLIGAPGCLFCTGSLGHVFVYSGRNGAPLRTLTDAVARDQFGAAVAAAGDVNSDGVEDVIVGAKNWPGGGYHEGRAYVYSGRDGSLLHAPIGEWSYGEFGTVVSGAGDVDGDGYDDFIVSAPYGHRRYIGGGLVCVYSGRTGDYLYTYEGTHEGERLGAAVCGLGDVDNDGHADYAIAAPGTRLVSIYSGKDGSRFYAYRGSGEEEDDEFGGAVCGSADLNGDGSRDLIIGVPGSDAGGIDAGQVYAYLFGDRDQDVILAGCDNCSAVRNPDQKDTDHDGVGDACDNCPALSNPGQGDTNRNGVGDACELYVDVREDDEVLPPMVFTIDQNYPNPFNSGTEIRFTVPVAGRVTLIAYDVLGREVKRLVDQELTPGVKWVTWDGTNAKGHPVSSGLYFYRLVAASFSVSRKMVVLK